MTIQESLRAILTNGAEIYSKICIVDTIDREARTVDVTPIDGGAPVLGVNLQANQESTIGVVAFPRAGSHVVVAFLNDAAGVVVLTEDVERMELKIGDENPVEGLIEDGAAKITIGETTIEIAPNKAITFNGGGLGGLVVIEELRKSLGSLKTYCETLKSATAAGLAGVGAGVAANGALGKTAFDGAMAPASIKIENMENDKIKHGK